MSRLLSVGLVESGVCLKLSTPLLLMLKSLPSVPPTPQVNASPSSSTAAYVPTVVPVFWEGMVTSVVPVTLGASATLVTVTVTAWVSWVLPSEATTVML